MNIGLRVRLSLMMFLQYYVWGIWLPMLYQRIGPNVQGLADAAHLNLGDRPIAVIFTVYGFGAILGPFILGQLADRYFATEKVLAVAHLAGGVLLLATAYQTTFWPIFLLLFAYCNLYMPTMGLSNSITFRSLGSEHQDRFPGIRLWGTIGWIVAGLSYAAYLNSRGSAALRPLFDLVGEPSTRDCLRVAGAVSLAYGLYCFALPHTPPVPPRVTDPIDKRSAVRQSLELMRNRSLAVLVIVAGLIGIMLAFYFQLENPFLQYVGARSDNYVSHNATLLKWGSNPDNVGAFMTIGQIAEVLVMLLVPPAVARLGVKRTMILGACAWILRFGLSMVGYPWEVMIATIALHGFCFGFFFVVAQMYVDRAAGADIKASAQNLLIFVVYGLGTIFGNLMAGPIKGAFTSATAGQAGGVTVNWAGVWAVPFVLTTLSTLAFALLFRGEEIRKPVAAADPLPA